MTTFLAISSLDHELPRKTGVDRKVKELVDMFLMVIVANSDQIKNK